MTATLGFLSVRHHPEHGYFGGYLIVNRLARPLEFHCTMPVKPSRAHQLLYGPTLDDFVCGEQIGKALTGRAKLTPALVLTDCSCVLALNQVSQLPIARLSGGVELTSTVSTSMRVPESMLRGRRQLRVGDVDFEVAEESALGEQDLASILAELSDGFDLTEPFQRVAEALLEAHPVTRAA